MTVTTPLARAAMTNDADWRTALERALLAINGVRPDVLFVFASYHHAEASASSGWSASWSGNPRSRSSRSPSRAARSQPPVLPSR